MRGKLSTVVVRALGAAFVLSGCSFEALQISLPALGESRAAAVALEVGSGGRLDRVEYVSFFDPQALDALGALPFDPEFDLDADARVSLLEYGGGRGLADFGYPAGRLEHAREGRLSVLSDHEPTIRELRVTGGELGEWRSRPEVILDGPVADFRFANRQPSCACLAGKVFETNSSTAGTYFLAAMGPERVIVGTEDGRLYWVRPDGLDDFTPTPILPFTERPELGPPFGGAVRISDNSLVITDFRGFFWRYDLDDNDRVRSTTFLGEWTRADLTFNRLRVRWMTYVPPLIYALDLEGRFGTFNIETGVAETIHDFEPSRSAYQHGGLAYDEVNQEVVVASVHSTLLGRSKNGEFRLDDRLSRVESLSAAFPHPSMGWLIGTPLSGSVHHEAEPGIWETCPSQLGNSIGAILPYGDGFIAGSTQGFIEQYSAADGWCEKLQPASNSTRFMVPYSADGTSFVVTGPTLEERVQIHATVTFIEPANQSDCDDIKNPGKDPPATCRFSDRR